MYVSLKYFITFYFQWSGRRLCSPLQIQLRIHASQRIRTRIWNGRKQPIEEQRDGRLTDNNEFSITTQGWVVYRTVEVVIPETGTPFIDPACFTFPRWLLKYFHNLNNSYQMALSYDLLYIFIFRVFCDEEKLFTLTIPLLLDTLWKGWADPSVDEELPPSCCASTLKTSYNHDLLTTSADNTTSQPQTTKTPRRATKSATPALPTSVLWSWYHPSVCRGGNIGTFLRRFLDELYWYTDCDVSVIFDMFGPTTGSRDKPFCIYASRDVVLEVPPFSRGRRNYSP